MKTIKETEYVDQAEAVIRTLKAKVGKNGRPIPMVTTSKIRNLLSMSADIYNEILLWPEETLDERLAGRIAYLRMRFIYEAGRENSVKDFVETAKLLDVLKEIGNSKAGYVLYNHYMEALIAFHKYYGGKD